MGSVAARGPLPARDGRLARASQAEFPRRRILADQLGLKLATELGLRDDADTARDRRINAKAGITPNATDEYSVNYTTQQSSKQAPLHVNRQAVQGYFFGKAMKFEEARTYFREKNRQPIPLPPMEEISIVSTLQ